MLIYSGTKGQFDADVIDFTIAQQIEKAFNEKGLSHDNQSEFMAWQNSLSYMQNVLSDDAFNDDISIAIEYQIPQTSKRVDFIVAGADSDQSDNVVIIELKQWEEAERTSRHGVVTAFTGGSLKAVPIHRIRRILTQKPLRTSTLPCKTSISAFSRVRICITTANQYAMKSIINCMSILSKRRLST